MKDKINLCFFSGDITNSGGTERVTSIIINELNKRNKFNISIVSLVEKKDTPFFELSPEIDRYALYNNEVRGVTHIISIITRLKRLVRKKDIDILVDIDGILDMYSIPVKWLTGIKIISWEHYNFYQNPYVPYRKITRKMAARWADAIVTLTDEDKGYYKDNLKIKGKITSIYNPIIWKETVGNYDINSKMILSVGRLTYQKGFDILIEVADLFLQKYPDWKWIVLGEGEDREQLEAKTKKLGLQTQVLFLGNVQNIDEYYSKAAMFVMTSRFEGLPMTLLETKPHKLPIISFDCKTGPKELILEGQKWLFGKRR